MYAEIGASQNSGSKWKPSPRPCFRRTADSVRYRVSQARLWAAEAAMDRRTSRTSVRRTAEPLPFGLDCGGFAEGGGVRGTRMWSATSAPGCSHQGTAFVLGVSGVHIDQEAMVPAQTGQSSGFRNGAAAWMGRDRWCASSQVSSLSARSWSLLLAFALRLLAIS